MSVKASSKNKLRWLASPLAVSFVLTAASAGAQETGCYDAEVTAAAVSQTPTLMPDCGDCIVMRWPWIVDLEVLRVRAGPLRPGTLTVLTLQHNDYRSDVTRWRLRRNTIGGYNVVGVFGGGPTRRCASNEPPARAYITPTDGKTLEDFRREGRAYFYPDS